MNQTPASENVEKKWKGMTNWEACGNYANGTYDATCMQMKI